jgi:hypothetical protein
MSEILAEMKQKRGTAAAIAAVNPVLREREICVESDTGKFKIGNGTDAWADLPYASGSGSGSAAIGQLAPAGASETDLSKTAGASSLFAASRAAMTAGELTIGALIVDENGTVAVVTSVSGENVQAATVMGGLRDIATVLQADETKFIVSRVEVHTPGAGYAEDDAVTATSNGETVSMTVAAVDGSGGIEALSFDGGVVCEPGNPAGANLPVDGGSGSGASVNVVTRYAEGTQAVEGHLRHVPDLDPLVQASRLRAYIAQTLLARLPVGTDDIRTGAVTAAKLADDAIFAGANISVSKTEMGIEISFVGGSGSGGPTSSLVTLAITDQEDEPIPDVVAYSNEVGDLALMPMRTDADGQAVFGARGATAYEIQVRDNPPFADGPWKWEHFYLAGDASSMSDFKRQIVTEEAGTPTAAALKWRKLPNYANERRWRDLLAMIEEHADVTYSAGGISTFGSFSGTNQYQGLVLAPNGHIIGISRSAGNILDIDPKTKTATTFGAAIGEYIGGVLAPDGHIYCAPFDAIGILDIDPDNRTAATFYDYYGLAGSGLFLGGVLAPNGCPAFMPFNTNNSMDVDPIARRAGTSGIN